MKMYEGMLPINETPGHLGYYPVTNKEEWEALPDLYKTMQWEPVIDRHNSGILKAVKSVIFNVVYMEPYGIRAKVSVHPSDVQKILFCSFKNSDCLLYSVCGIELESGTQLNAKWLQDSVTGSFAIVSNGQHVGVQGAFRGFIPEGVNREADGTFKYDYSGAKSKVVYYELSNPFGNDISRENDNVSSTQAPPQSSLTDKIKSAETRTSQSDSKNESYDVSDYNR